MDLVKIFWKHKSIIKLAHLKRVSTIKEELALHTYSNIQPPNLSFSSSSASASASSTFQQRKLMNRVNSVVRKNIPGCDSCWATYFIGVDPSYQCRLLPISLFYLSIYLCYPFDWMNMDPFSYDYSFGLLLLLLLLCFRIGNWVSN